ncbi:hypothetical protein GCM10010841_26360 [Deinococcus aerophilus]|uniref:Diguanylate cyclase n=2 Tax=Deinococcus aerophilus TaxID=522488 RepID=A0ABQ2GW96_9DEIO|nr:hypothetical protein GCM10010841_26360 [Deinococcus aerophilus]
MDSGGSAAPPDAPARVQARPGLTLAALGRWTLFVGTLLTATLGIFAVRLGDHDRVTIMLLADAGSAINRHRALEWQGLAAQTRTQDLLSSAEDSQQRLQRVWNRLEQVHTREHAGVLLALRPLRTPRFHAEETLMRRLFSELLSVVGEERALFGPSSADTRSLEIERISRISERLEILIERMRVEREMEAERMLATAMHLFLLTLLAGVGTLVLFIRRFQDVQHLTGQLRRDRQEARERETRDSLTGVWNRLGLQATYDLHWSATECMVVMLDLNRLKTVNDTGGHAAGDVYLRKTAQALTAATPFPGEVARWGGDEFVVLLPGSSEDVAHRLARQAMHAIGEVDGLPPFAYGLAVAPPARPLQRALALADAAMYEHKDRQRQRLSPATDPRTGITVEEFSVRLEQLETPQQVLGVGLPLVRDLLGFTVAIYLERADDVFTLRHLLAPSPATGPVAQLGDRYRGDHGLLGRAISGGQSVWSNDYSNEPEALPQWTELDIRSLLLVPVRCRAQVQGVLGLAQLQTWQAVTPQARRLLEAVAGRLGHAMEQERAVDAARRSLWGGLFALGVALEERDLETAGHTERVLTQAQAVGRHLGLTREALDALSQGAFLHDIGKLTIPDAILRKPGPLTPEEWTVMKTHAQRGHDIARRLPDLPPATLTVVRSHHERWNGEGYPDGLVGDAIPLEARIFAVCDVYDALTHARPYKAAWTPAAALAEIEAQRGRHFDPAVVDAFVAMFAPCGPLASPAAPPHGAAESPAQRMPGR